MSSKDSTKKTTTNGLRLSNLRAVFVIFAIVLGFIVPKIYVASNIYYKSLEIEREKSKLLVLENERLELELELERYKFMNDIKR